MNRRKFRSEWLRLHKRYEARGLRLFRKGIRQAAMRIPFDNLDKLNYIPSITFNVGEISYLFVEYYTMIGLAHGKKVGRAINKELRQEKDFNPTSFESGYRESIRLWLLNNAGTRITSVREELIEYLIKFIADGLKDGKDIRTISRELEKHILSRGFYRWQIERIVRTETTAAANEGAVRAGRNAKIVWEKEWISSRDARTRRRPDDVFDHYDIDGLKVDKDVPFNIQGDLLDYPGDPKGQAANVINCRCTIAIVPKRDENGRIVRTDRELQVV